jgi:hypothetical protein
VGLGFTDNPVVPRLATPRLAFVSSVKEDFSEQRRK